MSAGHLHDAEQLRQKNELTRQSSERERVAAEQVRIAAEEGRRAVAQEVTGTVATLTALLDRMEAVEELRRASHHPEGPK